MERPNAQLYLTLLVKEIEKVTQQFPISKEIMVLAMQKKTKKQIKKLKIILLQNAKIFIISKEYCMAKK